MDIQYISKVYLFVVTMVIMTLKRSYIFEDCIIKCMGISSVCLREFSICKIVAMIYILLWRTPAQKQSRIINCATDFPL